MNKGHHEKSCQTTLTSENLQKIEKKLKSAKLSESNFKEIM
jgi:hypothetical protein